MYKVIVTPPSASQQAGTRRRNAESQLLELALVTEGNCLALAQALGHLGRSSHDARLRRVAERMEIARVFCHRTAELLEARA